MKYKSELQTAIELAKQAGEYLLNERQNIGRIYTKKDKSLVCRVDKKSSDFLTKSLLHYFPDYGLLDEENKQDLRGNREYFWVIDPLDGTIEYINDGSNFGLMIGLVHKNKPILGVTYAPVKKELIYAIKGYGAFLENQRKKQKIKVYNSKEINVLISARRKSEELDNLLKKISPKKITNMPSSFKTLEVAKGNATLFLCPETNTMNLWDLCAPQIILEEAGGKLTDLYGKNIDYNGDTVNRNGVIASNNMIHNKILGVLK